MALDDQTASDDIPQYNGTPNRKSKFKCDVCVDTFFDCKYCFEHHGQLHHIKTVYVSRGKVFYKCDECCDMYFECKHCLNIHKMQLHSNDKSDFKMCNTCSQMYADKCELFSTYGEFREQFNRLVYLKIDNFHLMCDCVLFVIIFIIAYIFYLSKIFSYHLL